MRRSSTRGVVLMLVLVGLILLLGRVSDWWTDVIGPTGTGPRSAPHAVRLVP